MKNRDKILNNIVVNVLELMPPDKDELYITIDHLDVMQTLELEIKLNIREIE